MNNVFFLVANLFSRIHDHHSSYIFGTGVLRICKKKKSISNLVKFISKIIILQFDSISAYQLFEKRWSHIICAFWRYVFSNCVYVWLENHKKDTRIGLRCHIQDAHVLILYIFSHKFDCIYGMDTPPIAHIYFPPMLKRELILLN